EYRKYIERDAALERRFQPVMVEEPTLEQTIEILLGVRERYEQHHKVTITDDAVRAAADLSIRYITDRHLPDKAIDLIDEAASRMRIRTMSAPPRYRELEEEIEKVRKDKETAIENQEFEKAASLRDKERKLTQKKRELEESWRQNADGEEQPEVGEDEIADIVSMWTGIPVFKLTEAESQKLIRMEDELHKRVIGQEEAIVAVAKSIRRARAGIKDPKRPTGSFIFLGPSGVGKTELARTLAEFLFGDEDAMIQVDMSEYMEKHSVSRLVGSPPGYIGYDEGGQLTEAETQKLIRMEDELHKRVIGQHEAIVAVSKSIRRARAGIKDPKRPTGSFIFLGPSGVGKTELARTLAEFLFGDEDALIQVDMSEYMEKHSVSRLVGSPPGYIGYDEGGQLTEAVRRKPYSVVLLDEIEKAHPDVFNILLQILEDGKLTDAQGRKVDFRNTIVIMTSNIGAASISKNQSLGFSIGDESGLSYEDMKDRVMGELKKIFRPELLNRIDEVIVFHKLSKDEIKTIVDLLLKRLREQMVLHETSIELTDDAKEMLVEKGYDPAMGARPLRRAIQRHIEDPLADFVLGAELTPGSTIMVDRKGDDEVDITIIPGEPREPEKVAVPAGDAPENREPDGSADEPDEPAV
ncbi:MAG TPA: ATP-dependent Clp protease ATP-binding subunit, partial [Gaiellaceae bacterium]|nr:ATP-dependent Clp protease ATP-binding subunit [Gaiellaceae bacterium]